jgi:hypothetical protein
LGPWCLHRRLHRDAIYRDFLVEKRAEQEGKSQEAKVKNSEAYLPFAFPLLPFAFCLDYLDAFRHATG